MCWEFWHTEMTKDGRNALLLFPIPCRMRQRITHVTSQATPKWHNWGLVHVAGEISVSLSLSDDASLVFTESKGTVECLSTGSPPFTAGLCCRSVNESVQLKHRISGLLRRPAAPVRNAIQTRNIFINTVFWQIVRSVVAASFSEYLHSSRFTADWVVHWNCGRLGHSNLKNEMFHRWTSHMTVTKANDHVTVQTEDKDFKTEPRYRRMTCGYVITKLDSRSAIWIISLYLHFLPFKVISVDS
jgi:hypothetical protein